MKMKKNRKLKLDSELFSLELENTSIYEIIVIVIIIKAALLMLV